MKPDVAFIALGSNLGDRAEHLARARARISAVPGVTVLAQSSIEETLPVGMVEQPGFLNQMIAVRTVLAPDQLLHELQRIEHEGGRARTVRYGPRTIDLDIVAFEKAHCRTDELTVPHPELARRSFWQRELTELRAALDPAGSDLQHTVRA